MMTDPRENMPTIYENEAKMLNGSNGGGESLDQLVLVVQTPTSVKENGTKILPITTNIMPNITSATHPTIRWPQIVYSRPTISLTCHRG